MTDDVEERLSIVVREACWCGLSHDGQTVFCDDQRLITEKDPYGKPIYQTECDCRRIAALALSTLRPGDEINGCVLAPKLPTEEMIMAWVGAGGGESVSPALRLGAMRDWCAMLAASKETPDGR